MRLQPARSMPGVTGGVARCPWDALRSGAFNAERRKPVVDRGELTQKTHKAVKGPWVVVEECLDDGVAGFCSFCVGWVQFQQCFD